MPSLPVTLNPGLPATASNPTTTLLPDAVSPDTTGQPAEQIFGQIFGNILTGMTGETSAAEGDADPENPVLALPVDLLMISMIPSPPASEPQPVPETAPETLLSMLSANAAVNTGSPVADGPDISAGDVLLPAVTPANPLPDSGNLEQYTVTSLQTTSQSHAAAPPAELTAGNNSASPLKLSPEHPDPIRPELIEGRARQESDNLSLNSKLSGLANNQAMGTENFADSGKILPPVATPAAVHANGMPFIDSTDSSIAKDAPAVAAEFGHPDWPEEFGQKITWLATQRMQAAELKLHPAHLGPIEISLQISADQQLTAHFISHHAGVRDAIEANLPRLREIMAENGITLADTSVSADTPGQQAENRQQPPRHPAESGHGHFHYDSAGPHTSTLQITRHTGIIDTFA